jgi:beta-glucosidase
VEIEIDRYAGSYWDESEGVWRLDEGDYGVSVTTGDEKVEGKWKVEEGRVWLGL